MLNRFRWLLVVLLLVGLQATMIFPDRALAAIGDIFTLQNSAGSDVFRVTSDGDVVPGADNAYDLGTASLSFNDAHIQGTATIGTVTATTITGAATFSTLTATGNVTMNDAGADTLLFGDTADTVTVTSNTLSLTDDQWSVNASGVASFAGTTVTTLSATGDVDLGNAATDTITMTGVVDSGLTFVKEVARTIKIAASTTDSTAGAALTIAAGDGAAVGDNNGGNTTINAGNAANSGTDGSVLIGAANTSAVTITPNTTVSGTLNVVGALTQNGNAVKKATDEVSAIVPVDLAALDVSTNGTVALVRNAQGDWSLNQTSGGAETTYISSVVPYKLASNGAKLTGIDIMYEIAVADATSVDLVVDSTAFVQATAPAVTASHGGAIVDGDYDTDHDTAAERADKDVTGGEHVLSLTLNTPAYYTTANGIVRWEAAFVLQNTGTLKVRQVVLHYTQRDL